MIEIIIGILGLFIAWLTYIKTFHSKPNEEKENFLAIFLATQKLSKELSLLMTEYAIKKNAMDVELFNGVSYRTYIEALKESQATNLTDDLFKKLQSLDLTKANIASMQQSLQAQHDELLKIKSFFLLANKEQ